MPCSDLHPTRLIAIHLQCPFAVIFICFEFPRRCEFSDVLYPSCSLSLPEYNQCLHRSTQTLYPRTPMLTLGCENPHGGHLATAVALFQAANIFPLNWLWGRLCTQVFSCRLTAIATNCDILLSPFAGKDWKMALIFPLKCLLVIFPHRRALRKEHPSLR